MRCTFNGTSNIEQSQFFDVNFYCLIIKYITIVKMRGLTNDLYIVRRECQGSILLNLLITPIPFIDLVTLSLIWWLKLSFSSTNIPKWFWKLTQETGILLKKTSGWNDLVIFLEKKTAWFCLFKSGLNDIFDWCAHSAIFCKSLFNSLKIIFCSKIGAKKSSSEAEL